MKKLIGCVLVFLALATVSGTGVARAQDFFQVQPPLPEPPQPPQPPQVPQVRELNVNPFGGGTYLGVNLAEIDANRAKELKLKEDYGVEITRVEDNSPAEKAGLKAGDVVLEYNGERVEGMEQFGRLVRETPAGREVKLTVSRDGKTQKMTAMLESRRSRYSVNFPPSFRVPQFSMPDIPQIYTATRSARLGVEAEALGDQLAAYFGVKQGVLVRAVLDNTPAQKAGIKAGDVITKVDGMTVTAPGELSSAVRQASSKGTYAIEVMRDRKPVTVTVAVEDRSQSYIPRGRPL
jgi:serine protease Do